MLGLLKKLLIPFFVFLLLMIISIIYIQYYRNKIESMGLDEQRNIDCIVSNQLYVSG